MAQQESDDSERWRPSQKELKEILRTHEQKLESDREDGALADLSGADLRGRDLSGANLKGADLSGVCFTNAILTDATLRESTLRNADLTGAEGLQARAIAQADVSNADLPPEIGGFEGLQRLEKAAGYARKLFITILAACVYSWFTTVTLSDADLIVNRGASRLPILGTSIPHVGFFWIGPFALVMVYVYFHLQLQRIWEELSALPAIFPDGRPLDEKADPWLLLGLVRAHVPHLRSEHRAFFALQKGSVVVIAWWLVPLTLLVFGLRYLPKHDVYGTMLHLILAIGAVWFAISFYRNAKATLRGKPNPPFLWRDAWRDWRVIPVVGFSLGLLSILGLFDSSSQLKHRFPGATFEKADLRGVDLRWVDLQNAKFNEVDLRHSNLAYADLYSAWLRESVRLDSADLSSANLNRSQAHGVSFKGANLSRAYGKASLQEANLAHADLSEARLGGGVLRQANLKQTDLRGAELWGVSLEEADLSGANLQGAALSYESIKDTAGTDAGSQPPDSGDIRRVNWVLSDSSTRIFVRSTERKQVLESRVAELGEAMLEKAALRNADLRGAEVTSEQLCATKTLHGARLDQDVLQSVEARCPERLRRQDHGE